MSNQIIVQQVKNNGAGGKSRRSRRIKMKNNEEYTLPGILFLILTVVLIGSSIYRHSLDWNNLGSAIKVVQFSQQEATDYQKDIFLAVQGNKKPLEMLLDKFQREKRYGFLPALPSNYGNRSDIFWIEGRPLLSTPSKKF